MRSYDAAFRLPLKESPDLAGTQPQPSTPVSATVYLEPYTMECIKRVCRDENRRISDVISDAVERYLRERTQRSFED